MLWSRDHVLETWVHSSSFCPGLGLGLETWWPRFRPWSRYLKKFSTTTLAIWLLLTHQHRLETFSLSTISAHSSVHNDHRSVLWQCRFNWLSDRKDIQLEKNCVCTLVLAIRLQLLYARCNVFFRFLVFTCHLHHHLLHQNTTWYDSLVLVDTG